ncbi:unnamed protein product [Camellia sinensis]
MLLVLSCSAGMAVMLFVEQLYYCTALSPSVADAAFCAAEIRDFGCYSWMLQLLLQPIWMPLFGLLQNLVKTNCYFGAWCLFYFNFLCFSVCVVFSCTGSLFYLYGS